MASVSVEPACGALPGEGGDTQVRRRIESVEVLRTTCMFIIVLMHCSPFVCRALPDDVWRPGPFFLDVWWRFTIPFFFTAAGFFLAVKLENEPVKEAKQRLFRYVFRAVCVWAVWNVFYVLPGPGLYAELGGVRSLEVMVATHYHGIYRLLWEGFRGHLWFLTSLAVSALLLGSGILLKRTVATTCVSFVLFLAALLGGPYAGTALGFDSGWNLRDGPFIGAIMMHGGYWLCRYRGKPGRYGTALGILAAGLALYAAELWLFVTSGRVPLHGYDYTAATPLLGIGLLAVALTFPSWRSGKTFSALGKYSLGIYASHFYFLLCAIPYLDRMPLWAILGLPFFVYASALMLTLGMSRVPVLKRLVM